MIEVAEGYDEHVCRTNPLRCRVSGGYTISKQSGFGADSSPETLLTCILQVRRGSAGMPNRVTSRGDARPTHPFKLPLFLKVRWAGMISKQSGFGADSSPETLLTCILQVRRGCGGKAWHVYMTINISVQRKCQLRGVVGAQGAPCHGMVSDF